MSGVTISRAAAFPNDVRLTRVHSSWIKAVGYQPDEQVLYVMTQETDAALERIYPYYSVDATTYARFMEAPSKGVFYNLHVRGQFKYDGEGRVITFPNQANMHRVASSWIKAVGYNADSRVLYVMTKETDRDLPRLYPYFGVEAETFARFMNARSKGKFYNEHVKGRYAVERII